MPEFGGGSWSYHNNVWELKEISEHGKRFIGPGGPISISLSLCGPMFDLLCRSPAKRYRTSLVQVFLHFLHLVVGACYYIVKHPLFDEFLNFIPGHFFIL